MTITITKTERQADNPGAVLDACRDLREAQEIWSAIEAQRPGWDFHSTWISFRTWMTHFGGGEASVLKMTDGGRPMGLFPAHCTRRRMGPVNFRVLGSLGNEHWWTGYVVIGSEPEAAVRVLICGLSRRRDWDVLEVGPMAAACPQAGLLLVAGEETGLAPMTCHREDDWRVRISGTWEDYFKGRGSSLRRDVSRGERRLAKLGEVTFEIFSGGPDLAERFAEFCQVEGSGWKGQNGTAIRCNASVMRFHEDLMHAAAERNQLRLYVLRLNGKAVACQEVIIHHNEAYAIKIGRDETLDECGVGNILLSRVLKSLFLTNEAHTFDQLIGGGAQDAYKARWATEKREYVTLRFFNPRTVRGLLARRWFSLQAQWRTWRAAREETPAAADEIDAG
jgi:CelD/BcsL family acetyltransferase involved in cellulose biosynthesis